jgi:hypothetical protein
MLTIIDRLSVLVACPTLCPGTVSGKEPHGPFGVVEDWRMESPGETIRNYANSIARVNTIFETDSSSVLGLPQIVRRSTASR